RPHGTGGMGAGPEGSLAGDGRRSVRTGRACRGPVPATGLAQHAGLTDGGWCRLLQCLERCPLVAVNCEQAVEVGGTENLLEDRRELAQPELAPGGTDPALDQDQLGKHAAGDQVDLGEIEDQADRSSVAGQADRDLFRDLANSTLIEKQPIIEANDLDAVGVVDLDPDRGGHVENPGKDTKVASGRNQIGVRATGSRGIGIGFPATQPGRPGQTAGLRACLVWPCSRVRQLAVVGRASCRARATESRAAARSATNSNKGASLLARNTSLTVGSTLQKINLPPFCRASRCKATKTPSDADPAKPTPPRSITSSGRPCLRRWASYRDRKSCTGAGSSLQQSQNSAIRIPSCSWT